MSLAAASQRALAASKAILLLLHGHGLPPQEDVMREKNSMPVNNHVPLKSLLDTR